MTKLEQEALKNYFRQVKQRGQKPSTETAMHFVLGYCGYIEGFTAEFEKLEVKPR